jgi:hypothetical protein
LNATFFLAGTREEVRAAATVLFDADGCAWI